MASTDTKRKITHECIVEGRRVFVVRGSLRPPRPVSLTPAEKSVASMALRGLSTADIAALRESAPKTVANQLASVYRKLDISSREELVQMLARGES